MKSFIKRLLCIALISGCMSVLAQTTGATPIRLVVGQAAGGGLDVLARTVMVEVSKTLGTQVVIDNKPGSGGIVAAGEVSRAAADGKTFLLTTLSPLVNNPFVYSKLPYDANSFTPVISINKFPLVIYVRAESAYKSLAELVAAGKSRPGSLNLGTMGSANLSNLAGELIAEIQGFRFLQVPFNSEPPMMMALAGGEIDFVITTVGGGLSLVQGGKLRVLGILDSERSPLFPNVPTMAELGIQNAEAAGISAMVAPAGTPRELIERMNDAVNRALRQPDVRKKMQDLLMVPMGGSTQDLVNLMRSEGNRWVPIIKRLGIKE